MGVGRRFDAVFFDLGHTLVCPHPSFPELFVRVCAEHNVALTLEQVGSLIFEADREIAALQASGGGFSLSMEDSRRFWLSLYRRSLEGLGRPYPDHLPEALYQRFTDRSIYRVYPDVMPALTALRAGGVRMGAISNWEAWCEELIIELELAPLFDFALISGVLGIEKPDPRLFQMALERAGVPAARAAHVGDNPDHDCEAARAAGITPVLLDRYDRHGSPGSPAGCVRMTNLTGFADWVLGTNG
jgi:putative hydrolase of the HAD superfamily